jgi:hypothetical protein
MTTESLQLSAASSPAFERLYDGVTILLESENWRRLLRFRQRFHHYSFQNTALIYLQRPDATLVAGYRRWQELGRQVRRGERGILILAPVFKKAVDADGDEERTQLVGFRSARVFAFEQTEGEPLPEQPEPQLLTSDTAAIRQTFQRALTFSEGLSIPIERYTLPVGVMGRYNRVNRTIALRPDLPPLQALKTLIHELAHALMHAEATTKARHRLELEAETCAFLVCDALGLDTAAYSFAYLASWTDEPKDLLLAGEQAAKTARLVLAALKPEGHATALLGLRKDLGSAPCRHPCAKSFGTTGRQHV